MPAAFFIEVVCSGEVWTIYQVVPKKVDSSFLPVIQQLGEWEEGRIGVELRERQRKVVQEEATSIIDMILDQTRITVSEESFCRDETDHRTRHVVCIPGRQPRWGDEQWLARKRDFAAHKGSVAYDLTRVWALHYPEYQLTILVEACVKLKGGPAAENQYCRNAMQRAFDLERLISDEHIHVSHSYVQEKEFRL